jgi:hypothetical protein
VSRNSENIVLFEFLILCMLRVVRTEKVFSQVLGNCKKQKADDIGPRVFSKNL